MSEPLPASGDFDPRVLELPGGRSLVVRELRPEDRDGLFAFYRDLPADDRRRRFFTSVGPSEASIERILGVAEQGGFCLVGVVGSDVQANGPIVAEAMCARLGNGDGELGLAVADGWRGWLGPYLLDVVLETAAARGMANVEADVLTDNQAMLALAKARGYVTMDHEDWSIVRVVLGAASRDPGWPGPQDRPRLLVEARGGRWQGEGAARAAGLQVVVCPGPTGRRRPCPALVGHECPLAAGADAILLVRPPVEAGWDQLIDAHHELHAGVPVCLQPRHVIDPVPDRVTRLPAGDDEAVAATLRLIATAPPRSTEPGSTHPTDPHRGVIDGDAP